MNDRVAAGRVASGRRRNGERTYRGREARKCRRNGRRRKKRDVGRLTLPTKSCVRVSLGGFDVRGEFDEAMAIWMTASISSFVGPEPAADGRAAVDGDGSVPGADPVLLSPGEVEDEGCAVV